MILQRAFDFFKYTPKQQYVFSLDRTSNDIIDTQDDDKNIFPSLSVNLDYIKTKYNTLINSDIVIRNFKIPIRNIEYNAFLLYIDGMVDNDSINDFILQPLLLKNSINMRPKETTTTAVSRGISVKKVKKFNLEDFIFDSLIPHNSITKENKFSNVISKVNGGFCALFIDTLNIAFSIETKNIKGRSISVPLNENVIRGSHEAFIENIRTNTAMIRKIVNNENLVIEQTNVGKISKTSVAICYIKTIANESLVSEVKFRINNLDVDYLTSSGQLEQFIQDSKLSPFPQMISTERSDKVANNLFDGKVAVIVNGSPFVLILPGVFIDFLKSPEDDNLNYVAANFLRIIRLIATFFAIFLPGMYVAITNFHQELLPSELLFAIASSREAIPFPVIFEILLMEVSFELIREAGLRVASSFSTTVGIIGALILRRSSCICKHSKSNTYYNSRIHWHL